jgi:uncharacterized lipoprotein YmbA
MKKWINNLVAFAFVALFAAGCTSAPSKFYTLNSTAKGDGKSQENYAIAVGPVSIPMEVDRPQFTIQSSANRIEIDEFNRWAEPLSSNIARIVARDLAVLLGTPRVIAVIMPYFDAAYRVTIDIQRFESAPGKSAQIEAVWVVRKSSNGKSISGRTVAFEPVIDSSLDALAAAHSCALGKISSDIAAAVRPQAAKKP